MNIPASLYLSLHEPVESRIKSSVSFIGKYFN